MHCTAMRCGYLIAGTSTLPRPGDRIPSTLPMLILALQVQHLLRIETPQQYEERLRKFAESTRVLNPIHARHIPEQSAVGGASS